MAQTSPSCPMSRERVIERYFLEHRAKLLDLAAFLDRLDRSPTAPSGPEDFRIAAFRGAIALLIDGQGDRARRVLEHFSDPTEEPIPQAGGKGAAGAYRVAPTREDARTPRSP